MKVYKYSLVYILFVITGVPGCVALLVVCNNNILQILFSAGVTVTAISHLIYILLLRVITTEKVIKKKLICFEWGINKSDIIDIGEGRFNSDVFILRTADGKTFRISMFIKNAAEILAEVHYGIINRHFDKKI